MLPGRVQSLRTDANLPAVGVPRYHKLHVPFAQKPDIVLRLVAQQHPAALQDGNGGNAIDEVGIRGGDGL